MSSSTGRVSLLLALSALLLTATNGQISSPCTSSMISSFTPCINFLTNSTANGTPPTADCCNALKSLTAGSMDCACLLVNGNIPSSLPINRTLAVSLPRACNAPGVPLQCKSAGAPMAAPAPNSQSPTASTIPTTTSSPAVSPASDDTPDVGPTTPTVTADSPATTTETRQNVTPSAGNPSHQIPSSLLLFGLAFVAALKYY